MLSLGEVLKLLFYLKEASHRRPHSVWLHFCGISGVSEFRALAEAGGEGLGMTAGGRRVSLRGVCQAGFSREPEPIAGTGERCVVRNWLIDWGG